MSMSTDRLSRPLGTEWADAWNRFWFTPGSPLPLAALRVGVGASLVFYLLLLFPDVGVWMGSQGLVPRDLYQRIVIGGLDVNILAYWSIFNHLHSPGEVLAVHVVAIVIALLFTAGVYSRVTSVLSLVMLLQYVHRAPFVMGQVEPVLSFLLLYLSVSPCGAAISFDAWRTKTPIAKIPPSWTATTSLRLIQVHLAAFYLMMAVSKINGDLWLRGDGVWGLMAMTQARLIDLSALREYEYVLNAWSLAVVTYELLFAGLIWPRLMRPVVLWLGVAHWLLLLLASGLVQFCLLMLVANLAYVPADWWKKALTR